jgi:hypothetical protein
VTDSIPLCRVFGVRHLSPAAAFHLRAVLREVKPTAVLVEGPSDATGQLRHLVHKETRPPLAILCYTTERPVRSIVYPLASYSPEWIALTWGIRHGAETRLIDLPSSIFLGMSRQQEKKDEAKKDEAEPPTSSEEEGELARKPASPETLAYLNDPYGEIARLCGEPDHETWWERHFEHTAEAAAYAGQIDEFGKGLRGLRELKPDDENLVREAYMRREIRAVLDAGHDPEHVLVICGAFHASALTHELPTMSDAELAALPSIDARLTLMPYSYFRLSAQSGYGAGNHAPAYYQKLYDNRARGRPEQLPARFLTELCHHLRRAGHVRSAADVIEAVRLATSLAALKGSSAPTLRDLRDAAVTCLGRGEPHAVRPALVEVEVGTAVGRLPAGVSRTSIQDDFYLALDALNLGKFQTEKAQELALDLRENRYVKGAAAAFRDLSRSTFFHRLGVLDIAFAENLGAQQAHATWKEVWKLRWTPESEIQLVEGALLGDTVEAAAAAQLARRLGECERLDEAAALVRLSADGQLPEALAEARRRLQALAVDATDFVQLAGACAELGEVIRYGTVRRTDAEPLRPLLAQLFLRATLALRAACRCDDAAARKEVSPAFVKLADAARDRESGVDAERWSKELEAVAAADDLNPFLSGYATALTLSRLAEDALATEVGRRLSPGVPPDRGAGWFEGLVRYNREALFQRTALWRQLDAYVLTLDEAEFRRALVPLRRAFGDFSQGQVRRVVSNLVEVSPVASDELKAGVEAKLSDAEAKELQEALKELDLKL